MIPAKKLVAPFLSLTLILLACASTAQQQTVITVNPGVTLQTMVGWEATAQAGQVHKQSFPKYKDELFDLMVNDLGINRLRLEVRNGSENDVDYFSRFDDGRISRDEWRARRYEIVNDNDDPLVINPAGFHFGQMDQAVESVVLPTRQRLEARGEQLYLNLNYIDFGHSVFEHRSHPEEYAEFMLATFQHLRDKYKLTPDSVEVVLEADNAGWSGQQIGQAIVATGNRLKAHGFHPVFIAPSTTKMVNAIHFFDQMISVPGVAQYLAEISYHRYGGVSDENLQAIASRALAHGIATSHLEFIGATHEDLLQDLTLGRNSAWAQYTIAWPVSDGTDDGGKYYLIDDFERDRPKVIMGRRTRYLRQYFKYVRRGAVRIQAEANSTDFQPLAFVNADCRQVVIVNATRAGAFSLQGLPPGMYGIKYTTAAQYDFDHADATLSAGQVLQTSIPRPGVITIYAKRVDCAGLADVSAASYRGVEFAPESIVTVFGKDLATTGATAVENPLPTTLGETTVKIKDARGIERLAPLFLTSAEEITYQIPVGTALGPAVVSVINGTRTIALAGLHISRVAPGLFTANATGQGAAAGVILRVKEDNSQSYEPASKFDTGQAQYNPLPINLGLATDQVFLVLYGTGIRGYSDLKAVTARIGQVEVPVVHAQPLAQYSGIDQVTLRLPRALAGQGESSVSLAVDGKTANPVIISIK